MEIAKFITELASSAPSPGGGGVAALCGALSAALSSMVCELTSGKKKYAQYQADIERISERAKSLAAEFTVLMSEDEEAFLPLSRAYGLPKDAEGREEIIEAALVRAAEVPFRVLGKCRDAAELAAELAEKGSRLVVSDAGGMRGGGKKCGTQCLCQYEIDEEPRGGRCHCDGDVENGGGNGLPLPSCIR